MEENKGLKILGESLGWDVDTSQREFAWLKMMAAIKYDDYRDFLPGMRFMEYLAAWLQQFPKPEQRRAAYRLLRERLIYVSPPEMQRLVELFYPCFIERRLIEIVAARRKIPKYRVWVDQSAKEEFTKLRRRTLILGLSEGARIDILRHSTIGKLNNEQFVLQTQVDYSKWESLRDDLREAQSDPTALFEVAFLVDDFMGTGSSFLRFDAKKKKWTGKLCKFLQSLQQAQQQKVDVMTPGWTLCVHHYLATEQASTHIPEQERLAISGTQGSAIGLQQPSHYTFGATLANIESISPTRTADADLYQLTQSHYSDKIETKHTLVGNVKHLGLGYGACGLPLVLHHNTPNNSLAVFWAEAEAGPSKTTGDAQPEMRPLFRRRQRHTEA